MSCKICSSEMFKQKLGRCKQCMVINLIMLVLGLIAYLLIDLKKLQAVQEVALLMFIGATAILMSAHIIAWCFHRFKNDK
ncbi:DUF3624 family protein [Psychromonas algicola]|uniref:DUF3624 family protein n=1 Tax=Psychromonas algicola TaxID=2555642 RepID=UPI001067814E|nr:DUF3624 family protein [Psychromonas sp. RZ5]TEW52763.1 DUF3624 family protein [Psychromonas sp. RZ5]